MTRLEKTITYSGQPAKIACDGNCRKAWGINRRSKVQLSNNENDYEYLADSELGVAPIDPGTYEGRHGKPLSTDEFPNKWCARECERSVISEPGKHDLPIDLPDLMVRLKNIPDLHDESI